MVSASPSVSSVSSRSVGLFYSPVRPQLRSHYCPHVLIWHAQWYQHHPPPSPYAAPPTITSAQFGLELASTSSRKDGVEVRSVTLQVIAGGTMRTEWDETEERKTLKDSLSVLAVGYFPIFTPCTLHYI